MVSRVSARLMTVLMLSLISITVTADYRGMRDPTKPLRFVAESQGLASLSLHSVLISEERKFAVINGKQVKEQELINGAKVIAIQPGRVRLLINGREKELVMRVSVKQPARKSVN